MTSSQKRVGGVPPPQSVLLLVDLRESQEAHRHFELSEAQHFKFLALKLSDLLHPIAASCDMDDGSHICLLS